jgi:biopolymer transport protein ExbB
MRFVKTMLMVTFMVGGTMVLAQTATNAAKTNAMAGMNVTPVISTGGTNAAVLSSDATSGGSFWDNKFREGGVTAKVQLALSIFGGCFVFERLFRLRRKYVVPSGLSRKARALWQSGQFDALEKLGETTPSTLGRAIAYIAAHRQAPMLELSQIVGDMVSREQGAHYQRAYPLGIVAVLEPLLGLLGMILGMIRTFDAVAIAGALGDPTQLASGISEALVTTALGIATAVPFLAFYHVFKHRTTDLGLLLEGELTGLLSDWFVAKKEDSGHARQTP